VLRFKRLLLCVSTGRTLHVYLPVATMWIDVPLRRWVSNSGTSVPLRGMNSLCTMIFGGVLPLYHLVKGCCLGYSQPLCCTCGCRVYVQSRVLHSLLVLGRFWDLQHRIVPESYKCKLLKTPVGFTEVNYVTQHNQSTNQKRKTKLTFYVLVGSILYKAVTRAWCWRSEWLVIMKCTCLMVLEVLA
jgi:hypothetical protein